MENNSVGDCVCGYFLQSYDKLCENILTLDNFLPLLYNR